MVESRLGVQRSRLGQLDFAVVDPQDPDTGLTDHATHRAADAATDVDHRHALAQLQLGDHQALMPDLGFLQALPGRERGEVKRLAPAEDHQLAEEVVVLPDGFGVFVALRARIAR